MNKSFEVIDDSTEIFEMLDLLNFTFSNQFIEKWKYKYSESFVKAFRNKLLESVKKNKVLKKTQIETYLVTQQKYSILQVRDFFETIELDLYYPIIQ